MTATRSVRSGTVFIVDDDPSFLKSMSRLLNAVGYTVRAFESAQEFLEQIGPEISGCVVTDLQMPGMDGLKLQEALRKTTNPLPVIFLTGQGDIPATVSAMRRGAEDFLTKRTSKEELLSAIERAFERGAHERQRRGRLKELQHRFHDLSERELEVLGHVVQGKMNKEIAAALEINERTVKLHRTNITRKLKVQSAVELSRLADEAGLFKNEKDGQAADSGNN